MLARVIHGIIFDLDGTLVHSLPGITASLNRVLTAAGLSSHPESAVRGFIGDGIRKLVERAVPGTSGEALDALVHDMRSDYALTWKDGTHPYPGVTETLVQLADRRIPCAVFSNKPDEYCREITDLLFPGVIFPIVRGQLEGIPVKPDPTGALAISAELNLSPDTVAFVGDSTIDLETARNAGMIPVAATWGYHDLPALTACRPQHTIHTMSELIQSLTL